MFFSMDARPKFKEADPSLSFGDLAKKISAAWKEMDAEAKQPFEEQAAADKERWKRETAEYEAMKTEALAMLSSDSDSDGEGGAAAAGGGDDSD
jgi:hypothetical protein